MLGSEADYGKLRKVQPVLGLRLEDDCAIIQQNVVLLVS
jgi:hypothetical protein